MNNEHTRQRRNEHENLIKIRFPLSESDREDGVAAEYLWAEPIGNHSYRIDNIPFFVYGISLDDVVRAIYIEGCLEFQNVIRHNGHSTYRVILEDTISISQESGGLQSLLKRLEVIGCSRELAKARLIAIDVPTTTDIFVVYKILEDGEEQGIWSFEEAHCGHPV